MHPFFVFKLVEYKTHKFHLIFLFFTIFIYFTKKSHSVTKYNFYSNINKIIITKKNMHKYFIFLIKQHIEHPLNHHITCPKLIRIWKFLLFFNNKKKKSRKYKKYKHGIKVFIVLHLFTNSSFGFRHKNILKCT